jgi:hypothetical protein
MNYETFVFTIYFYAKKDRLISAVSNNITKKI